MNKELFMKKVKAEIKAVPKYSRSTTQVDAIAEQMWNEFQAFESKQELAKEQLEKIEPKEVKQIRPAYFKAKKKKKKTED